MNTRQIPMPRCIFLMPTHPDDILIAVGSADYRDDAGPHAFMYSQELLDYLNKQ